MWHLYTKATIFPRSRSETRERALASAVSFFLSGHMQSAATSFSVRTNTHLVSECKPSGVEIRLPTRKLPVMAGVALA